MITLYFVFDVCDARTIEDPDYRITTVNVSKESELEEAIDMSLLDFLYEPVKIVFMAKDSRFDDLVKSFAESYDVTFSSFLSPDKIDWIHKVIMKEEYYDLDERSA